MGSPVWRTRRFLNVIDYSGLVDELHRDAPLNISGLDGFCRNHTIGFLFYFWPIFIPDLHTNSTAIISQNVICDEILGSL